MRKSILIAIVFVFLISTSFTPKKEEQGNLSKIERLYLTCKIWGFMKYYHPLVSKGSYNWDEKLLSVLKNTAHIKTYAEFSDFVSKWIYYMGQIQPCNTCGQRSTSDQFLQNFDLSWTQSNLFSAELKSTLKNIEKNRFQGNHNYIEQGKAKQFEPKNEALHYDLNWEDERQRLIPLFRYWNYIEYFYPHKYQTEQDWDEVLKEMIQTYLEVNSRLEFHLAMLELVVKIDDSHAGLVTPLLDQMPYYNYLPARIDLIDNQVIVTKIIDQQKAELNNLQVGDILKTINGKQAYDLHNANKKYIWGSNDAVKNRSIYHTLFMGMKDSPQVTIERNGSLGTDNLTLYRYSDLSYTSDSSQEKWSILDDSIGYVDMGKLNVSDVPLMMDELMENQFIIFDVRNSPKGTSRAISKYLNPSDTTFAIFARPDFNYPGKFVWQGESTCGEENPDYFKGNVILLVNEETQNNAEFSCMCLQTAPQVMVIGSRTAGTLGNVSKFTIINRYYTSITGVGVFYPNRSEIQRIGIVPDIEVKPTIAGIREGRDEVLEKAVQVAKEEIERLKEIARLEELARQQAILDSLRLDSIRLASIQMDSLQMDSLQMDSLQMNTIPLDTLRTDTLKIDNNEDYK